MNQYLIFGIGLTAQILFSARLLVQWIASERANKILSPVLFWQLSMFASFMLCIYGWMRHDFAIISGQFVSYYIYIWNLRVKGSWNKIPGILRSCFLFIPPISVGYLLVVNGQSTFAYLFKQNHIPYGLLVFGIIGQLTFTLRFIYQWWYSGKAGESLLPVTFWLISLAGSTMIIIYAVIRRDPVLIIGQATGFVVYIRNIMIGYKAFKSQSPEAS